MKTWCRATRWFLIQVLLFDLLAVSALNTRREERAGQHAPNVGGKASHASSEGVSSGENGGSTSGAAAIHIRHNRDPVSVVLDHVSDSTCDEKHSKTRSFTRKSWDSTTTSSSTHKHTSTSHSSYPTTTSHSTSSTASHTTSKATSSSISKATSSSTSHAAQPTQLNCNGLPGFFLQASGSGITGVDGEYANLVDDNNGDYYIGAFTGNTGTTANSGDVFALNIQGQLIGCPAGGPPQFANLGAGATQSILYFNTLAQVGSAGYVVAECTISFLQTAQLQCVDQSNSVLSVFVNSEGPAVFLNPPADVFGAQVTLTPSNAFS